LLDSIGPHTWWRTARRIEKAHSRLLVMQWWHPFFAPAYASVARRLRHRGVPVLMICHNVLPHESSRLDGALVRLGLGSADAFVVHSETDREALRRLFPHKPHALTRLPAFGFFARGRVSRDEARAILGVQGPVVLFFGLVRRYKGLDVLLRAVARARPQLPVTLLVVGEFYEERSRYEKLRHELGLEEQVRFVDRYVPNEEVETYFRAADVVVLPYRSATQSAIVQIALSFQRPAIVTQVGGLPEAVRPGETGEVVPPEDPEALGAALVRFFASGAAARMAPHLRDAVSAFSWETLDEVLHDLAARLGLPRV
jgi:glycosyltransferase involved in cell wall biosynthesis